MQGHSRSKLNVPFDRAVHGEHFVNKHPQATGDGLPAMDDFNFRDLEMTLKSHPQSKVMTQFD